MAQFGLNVSTSQLEKLKKALNNADTSKLESTQLTGNAASIFAELNVNSDNAFKGTGLDKILNDIAGKDGEISQDEMKDFMGDDVFSMDAFVSVVENAVEEALKDIDIDETKAASASGKGNKAEADDNDDNEDANLNRITTKNYTKGDIKSKTVEKDEDGNIISKTIEKADGSTVVIKYENGEKVSQETTYDDGTKALTELKLDKDGNKIGATTTRFDNSGNLQSVTEADYDAKTGQKTHAKTIDANGEVQGEASYEIQKNADGSYAELRYQIDKDGNKTLTTTTAFDKEGIPQNAMNHLQNSIETFKTDSNGNITSSTVKSQDGTVLSEDRLDSDGNVLKHIEYTADGQIASETAYSYYDNGTVKSEDKKVYIEESKATSKANETEEVQTVVETKEYMAAAPAEQTMTISSSSNGTLPTQVKTALDNNLGAGFSDKLEQIARKVNCSPEDLVGLMYSESGLNSKAYNSNGGATGLIQFMPATASALGTTTQALSNMSPVEQLDYVDKFFDMVKGNKFGSNEKLNAGNLYGLVFLPAYAKNDVLCTSSSGYYSGNRGLDLDGDGAITNKDLTNRVQNKYKEFCRSMGVSV